MDQTYQPSSSSSEEEVSSRQLRSSQVSLSQSSDNMEMSQGSSQPSTPSCTQPLQKFHFQTPIRPHQSRQKKRKRLFTGTQRQEMSSNVMVTSLTGNVTETPKPPQFSAIHGVAATKLSFDSPTPKSKVVVTIRKGKGLESVTSAMEPSGNFVMNFDVLNSLLSMTRCKECLVGEMRVLQSEWGAGCASHLLVTCKNCNISKQFWTVGGRFTSKIDIGEKRITKRNEMVYASVLGGRLIGAGYSKIALYHSLLNIPNPCSASMYSEIQRDIVIAAERIAADTMDRARDELRIHANILPCDPLVKTIVSFDGAYQMRGKASGGFSRYCFGAAISLTNSKVVSFGIAANSCPLCSEYATLKRTGKITQGDYDSWETKHTPVCPAKYSEYASVQLESALAPSIVTQALNRGIVFSGMVTDGDNKTSDILKEANLYSHTGIEMEEIDRLECLSHVAKRLKINLCKRQGKDLKSVRTEKAGAKRYYEEKTDMTTNEIPEQLQEYSGKQKKDSRKRAEWDSGTSQAIRTISDAVAGQVASYYRLAIKRNAGNIPEIVKAVNAIPLHLGANDENAEENHRNCPSGPNSWCKYKSAIAKNEAPPLHPNFLSQNVVDMIFSVFDSFHYNSPQFLEKVQDGHTSNHNESLHSILWTMVPKNEPASFDNMRLGSALSVIRYNEGYAAVMKVCELLQITTTPHLHDHFSHLDKQRVLRSASQIPAQQKRYAKKQLRGTRIKGQLKKHGEGYMGEGAFSAAKESSHSELEIGLDIPTTSEQLAQDSRPEPEPSQEPPTSSTQSLIEEDTDAIASCNLCGGTEENGLVGIGVQVELPRDELDWVECEECCKWYHCQCLGVELNDVKQNYWACQDC